MRKNRLLTGLFMYALILLSCTTDKMDAVLSEGKEDTSASIVCDAHFNVVLNSYDGAVISSVATRGAGGWEEGDMIYLILQSGTSTIMAEALYSGGKWTVDLTGKPVVGTESKCSAYYFEGAKKKVGSILNLSERSAVYEDTDGKYLYDGSSITVTSTLKPKLGRVRFAGNKNAIIKVFGFSWPSAFDVSKGTFSFNTSYVTDTVGTSGYTSYLYGFMSDSEDPRLYVVTKNSGFTKYCDERVFQAGKSGWLTIPSGESHFGWYEYLALRVKGYELKMMPIWYSTATTPYLMFFSETEVTEGLYNTAVGTGSKTSMKPKVNIKYTDADKFISETVSGLTGLKFCIPSKEEWAYAFGSSTYSGSDVLDEVGWYKDNSDDMIHNVKELNPNEYGLYDMSGNAAEYSTYYKDIYTYIRCHGGSYSSDDASCKNKYRSEQTVGLEYCVPYGDVGMRLCLKF